MVMISYLSNDRMQLHKPFRLNFIVFYFIVFVFFSITAGGVAEPRKQLQQQQFSVVDGFNEATHGDLFRFLGTDDDTSSIDGGALQLTPDTQNIVSLLSNKSGRIFYHQPFKLWQYDDAEDDLVSFTSTFLINVFRQPSWTAGHGLSFLIAPDLTIPDFSYGQWLGLTNATTDGDWKNHFVAIEFDTQKQEFDPDDNHIGLDVNSVRSVKAVSLKDFDIEICPADQAAKHTVWVHYYGGDSKLMEVYMAKEGVTKPKIPVLSEKINLKKYLKRESYFGFAASTGYPQVQLNCVLKWTLEMEVLPEKKKLTWLKIVVPVSILVLIMIIGSGYYYLSKKRRNTQNKTELGEEATLPETLKRLPGMPREFKYKELKKATNDFNDSMMLGQGGFGVVYKGVLDYSPQEIIAVKKFSRDSIKGKDDFLSELTIIHRLRHKHLVRLVGWCHERGQLLLVYDYMPNGSLEKYLYEDSNDDKNNNILNWERRYKILAGVASALHYLHKEYDQTVVHRDLKASNIMLDSDFNARLGDFGLARVLDNGMTSYAELGLGGVPGTMGYVAPECFHTGKATPESDVFGFGVVLLEVVCGRNPGIKMQYQQHLHSLIDWVWMLHREGQLLEAVDEKLKKEYVPEEARKLLLLGLACSHSIATERPQTQAILQIITGNMSVPYVPPFRPVFTWPSINLSTDDTTNSSILSNSHSSS